MISRMMCRSTGPKIPYVPGLISPCLEQPVGFRSLEAMVNMSFVAKAVFFRMLDTSFVQNMIP